MKVILFLNGSCILESTGKLDDVKHLAAMKICSMHGVDDGEVFLIWQVVAYGRNNRPVLYKAKGFDCAISVVER